MVTKVEDITARRKAEREQLSYELRNTLALETIADTLEAIRIEIIRYGNAATGPTRESGVHKS